MSYLFTSESVSEGHPDKVADQISDAILDEFLRLDSNSKVACETFVSTGLVVVGGEVNSRAYVDIQQIARRVINRIGYTKAEYMFDGNSCGILSAIHDQSPDINRGVDKVDESGNSVATADEQGAGDQGMMFGYACTDTEEYMPLALTLSHIALLELAKIRKDTILMPYLRPDAKSQFTIEYDENNKPLKVHTIVISTQHDEFDKDEKMLATIKSDVKEILIPRIMNRLPEQTRELFRHGYKLLVNPTGKFVIGGPHGDTGLTGRKIIVDTYGGKGAHGGGAFSGKDPSKVDRSGAYAARHIAKNMVAAGVAREVLVQIAYAIGVAQPVSVFVNTFGTCNIPMNDSEIAAKISEIFDLRPAKIIERFQLKNPIYEVSASYGHMGRDPFTKMVEVVENGVPVQKEIQFFGWEKLDFVEKIKKSFGII
ncbi:S-adenosylmethionine synthase [Bacteroidales bacterium CF]|jgi:S-adenosylmethionine synthetase|nr:S-adenosylmethionine synthase [Bacteroidales bacterium CF]MDD3034844.1 methionine adenosyltransferase [Bacteroidales bacterium]MEA5006452.1 methionine adenosyltransferase [Rikenellaceae bacterium]NCB98028.1 methionine adenosyltransferase [Bacteroidia bacterium]